MAGRHELSKDRSGASALIQRAWAALIAFVLLLVPTAQAQERSGLSSMGIGLAGVSDWSVQQPFLDVMKTARPWIGHKPGQWSGETEQDLRDQELLDENGWPTAIPYSLRGIGTVILTDLPEEAKIYAGRYRLAYKGDGIVEVSGRADNVRYGEGQVEFDFTPGPGPVLITINRTDRRKTGNHIRDMTVVRLDDLDRVARGEMFNPDWLAVIKDFASLRFMDWMLTNESEQVTWNDRPRTDDVTWSIHGVPVEIMVRLANETGTDPWFNMPHKADDAYMRAFAEYVRDTLDPALTAYVEYSNEVWNWQFPQTDWAEQQSMARWDAEYVWMEFYGMRTAQMAAIWKDVYGDQAKERLVTIISTQTGWQGLEVAALEAPRWRAEDPTNPSPASAVDAYAISGYFGGRLGDPEQADVVHGWLAESLAEAETRATAQGLSGSARPDFIQTHRYDAAIALAARELRDGTVTGNAAYSVTDLAQNIFPYHAETAKLYDLDLIMYEGGTHVVGTGAVLEDDALGDFFIALNYAPEMGPLYTDLLAAWDKAGGQRFNVFLDVFWPSKWGSWGTIRYLGDDTSRWQALQSYAGPRP